jgi:hypothetical protein
MSKFESLARYTRKTSNGIVYLYHSILSMPTWKIHCLHSNREPSKEWHGLYPPLRFQPGIIFLLHRRTVAPSPPSKLTRCSLKPRASTAVCLPLPSTDRYPATCENISGVYGLFSCIRLYGFTVPSASCIHSNACRKR